MNDLMALRMITISETTVARGSPAGGLPPSELPSTSEHAYITDMDIPEFVVRFNARIEATCSQFTAINMRGWWHMISMVELGVVEPRSIAAMQSKHFPASLWLRRHEEPVYLDGWDAS